MRSTHTIGEPLFALNELEQRLRLAQLHQEVDVVLVFERIMQVNDVRMLELHVNFDFTFNNDVQWKNSLHTGRKRNNF